MRATTFKHSFMPPFVGTFFPANLVTGVGSGSFVLTGTNATLTQAAAPVTKDATSNIYVPKNASEWTALMANAGLATGNPTGLWLMQEASGDLADSIGTFTLTANNSPGYAASVSGWSRKAVTTPDAGANKGFFSTDAGLPDTAATSMLVLLYGAVTAGLGASQRGVIQAGTASIEARAVVTGVYRLQDVGNAQNGTSDAGTAVRPIVLKVDVTNTTAKVYTDQDKITTTWSANSGKEIAFGGFNQASGPYAYLYAAMFVGSAAELSDANVKTLLQTLGWTIAWS